MPGSKKDKILIIGAGFAGIATIIRLLLTALDRLTRRKIEHEGGSEYPQEQLVEVLKAQNSFRKIRFSSIKNRLVGNLYLPPGLDEGQIPGVFFIHGGTRGKSTAKKLQQYLSEEGYGSFAYDSSGVGESEGSPANQTLEERISDAEKAFEVFQKYFDSNRICVIGLSMGADSAIHLLKEASIRALILLAPAAYPEASRTEALYKGFTRRIRKDKESWQDAPAFSRLEEYSGPILTIYGEHDRIIPDKMIKRFQGITRSKGRFLILNNAQHNFLRPSSDIEKEAEKKAFSEISAFLSLNL